MLHTASFSCLSKSHGNILPDLLTGKTFGCNIELLYLDYYLQGGSGRFDLTVGPKQTMGKVVS